MANATKLTKEQLDTLTQAMQIAIATAMRAENSAKDGAVKAAYTTIREKREAMINLLKTQPLEL